MSSIQQFKERINLIKKFQEKLEVSRKEAVSRVAALIFLSLCLLAVIANLAISFPYAGSYTETAALLPGEYEQVKGILDGEVLVEEDKFLQMANKSKAFIQLGSITNIYMAKVAGISYRYDQVVPLRDGYYVSTQRVEGGFAVRELSRDIGKIIIVCFFYLVVIIFLLMLMDASQFKKMSGYGSSAVYSGVWKT